MDIPAVVGTQPGCPGESGFSRLEVLTYRLTEIILAHVPADAAIDDVESVDISIELRQHSYATLLTP